MLTEAKVKEVFDDCSFQRGLDDGSSVRIEGFLCNAEVHLGRLATRELEIMQLLAELPDEFRTPDGGCGEVMDKAQRDRNGRRWTNDPDAVEQLFMLGIAIGRAWFLRPPHQRRNMTRDEIYFTLLSPNVMTQL